VSSSSSAGPIVVWEDGRELAFSFDEMLRFHGGGSPGGVAHAFKVLERALPVLAPEGAQRRELVIDTAFGGPGARDAFELVTRAVSGERYRIDPSLARAELGRARERFVFRLRHHGREATAVLRDGFVTEAYTDLTRRERRTAAEEDELTAAKAAMAARVMAPPAAEVYDLAVFSPLKL
jgi:hypothetical protein